MKNAWIAVLAAAVALVSCEATFQEPDAPRDDRNVVLRHFFYFKNQLIDTNTTFVLDGFNGTEIRFSNIEFALGFYHFENHLGDTVFPMKGDTTLFEVESASSTYGGFTRVYKVPSGTYSGRHFWRVGLDSAQNAATYSPEAGINRLKRSTGGYNAITIEGFWKSPLDSSQTRPYKPFKYVVSSEALNELLDQQMSFTVKKDDDININIVVKANLLLDGADPAIVDQFDIAPNNPLFFPLLPAFQANFLRAYQIQL
ncbi:MAG: hypothetical protein ACO30N_04800 [Schleiferiaceae bacterium]